ncbi:hypothetical protein ABPG72_022315 [Tetrahymena utriculariae]
MVALSQTRVYTNCQVKWNIWNTYWSSPSRLVNCYSNCSGQCNSQTYPSGQCPADELNNSNLPEKEKSDPNNRFDDNLLFLLKSQQKNIPAQQNFMYLNLGCDEKHLILSKLRYYQENMLSLNEKDIPKGEKQRKQLYDFILSLQNLNSLEIQLAPGIYHINEENVQTSNSIKQYIPVSKEVVENFVFFLLKLKIENLSLILDEFLNNQIEKGQIFDCLPNINQKLKVLQLSVNNKRMYEAQHILNNLCKIKQLEVLNLRIKKQWALNSSSYGHIQEDFKQQEAQLKSSIKGLYQLQIE